MPEPFAHRLYIVRHGETDWNLARRLQGQTDIPLNDTGRAQARRHGTVLADLLARDKLPDFVTSPLTRARETMQIIRGELGLEPLGYRTDDRLKELGFGAWEGLTWKEVARADRLAYQQRESDRWNHVPRGGESYAQLSARVEAWLGGLERDTLVVSHGGVGRVLRGVLLGLSPRRIIGLDAPQDRIFLVEGRRERLV